MTKRRAAELAALPASEENLEAYARHAFRRIMGRDWHPRFFGWLARDRAASDGVAAAGGWAAPVLARPSDVSVAVPQWERLAALDGERERLGLALNELRRCALELKALVEELDARWCDEPDERDHEDPNPIVTEAADNGVRLGLAQALVVLEALHRCGVLGPRPFWVCERRASLPAAIIANTSGRERSYTPHELAIFAVLCGMRPPSMKRSWTVKATMAAAADIMRKARARRGKSDIRGSGVSE